MEILQSYGINAVYHYAPLHYLVFIARARQLKSKPILAAEGYQTHHFRSKSKHLDERRGFGNYIHLTLAQFPNILNAKLSAGFPHVKVAIPATLIDKVDYVLCRYNIAMTRYIKTPSSCGFIASPTNGRYYDQMQIPVAKTDVDKRSMLEHHLSKRTMIEVLIKDKLALPATTAVTCYSQEDADIAAHILKQTQCPWKISLEMAGRYPRHKGYVQSVAGFVKQALADAHWKGDGLEFDKL